MGANQEGHTKNIPQTDQPQGVFSLGLRLRQESRQKILDGFASFLGAFTSLRSTPDGFPGSVWDDPDRPTQEPCSNRL